MIEIRRHPRYRTLAIVNFAAASVLGVVAYRNHGIGPTSGVH
jgi:hypothetical protein